MNMRRFLLGSASLVAIGNAQPRLTAEALANILARAYAGLGLRHLNQSTK